MFTGYNNILHLDAVSNFIQTATSAFCAGRPEGGAKFDIDNALMKEHKIPPGYGYESRPSDLEKWTKSDFIEVLGTTKTHFAGGCF